MRRCLILFLYLLCISTAAAVPQGFDHRAVPHHPRPQGFNFNLVPNTVAGMLNQGSDGDYVLLSATAVAQQDPDTYIFADQKGDTIEVKLENCNDRPLLNLRYLLWGRLKVSLFHTYFDVSDLSAPLLP